MLAAPPTWLTADPPSNQAAGNAVHSSSLHVCAQLVPRAVLALGGLGLHGGEVHGLLDDREVAGGLRAGTSETRTDKDSGVVKWYKHGLLGCQPHASPAASQPRQQQGNQPQLTMASVTGSLNIEWMSFFWQRTSRRSKSSRLGGPVDKAGTAGMRRRPSPPPPSPSPPHSWSVPAVSAASAPAAAPVRASEGAGPPADRPRPVEEGAATALSAACLLHEGEAWMERVSHSILCEWHAWTAVEQHKLLQAACLPLRDSHMGANPTASAPQPRRCPPAQAPGARYQRLLGIPLVQVRIPNPQVPATKAATGASVHCRRQQLEGGSSRGMPAGKPAARACFPANPSAARLAASAWLHSGQLSCHTSPNPHRQPTASCKALLGKQQLSTAPAAPTAHRSSLRSARERLEARREGRASGEPA